MTPLQKRIAALEQELTAERMLSAGLRECLEVSSQMLVATLQRHGGTIRLTPTDYAASAGLAPDRLDDGDDIVLTVPMVVTQ